MDLQYRMYITDSLFYQPQRKRLTKRYADVIKPNKKEDNRSAKEIVEDIVDRSGITLK